RAAHPRAGTDPSQAEGRDPSGSSAAIPSCAEEGDELGGLRARAVHAGDLVLAAELAARPHPVVEGIGAGHDEGGQRQATPFGAEPLVMGVAPGELVVEDAAELREVAGRPEELEDEEV